MLAWLASYSLIPFATLYGNANKDYGKLCNRILIVPTLNGLTGLQINIVVANLLFQVIASIKKIMFYMLLFQSEDVVPGAAYRSIRKFPHCKFGFLFFFMRCFKTLLGFLYVHFLGK